MGFLAVFIVGVLQASSAKQEFSPVPFVEYLAGFSSRVVAPKTWVITKREEFEDYWLEALGKKPSETPKAVDFRRNNLVAIHLGNRATTGYNVYVQSVVRVTDDTALVTYVEQKPRPLAVVVQQKTSPWVLFRVPAGLTKFTYKQIVQTVKYPPVRDNVQPAKPDPDSELHSSG